MNSEPYKCPVCADSPGNPLWMGRLVFENETKRPECPNHGDPEAENYVPVYLVPSKEKPVG